MYNRIHESCPRCGKALDPSSSSPSSSSAVRVCQNCRRRVGLCFLCHEPVKGVIVWCPGCGKDQNQRLVACITSQCLPMTTTYLFKFAYLGHGGHLEHALQWFGGPSGKTVREVCPTGCGHRCNLVQTVSAFPRTDSLRCLPTFDTATEMGNNSSQMNLNQATAS